MLAIFLLPINTSCYLCFLLWASKNIYCFEIPTDKLFNIPDVFESPITDI